MEVLNLERKPIVGISMKIYKNTSEELQVYTNTLVDKYPKDLNVDVFILPSMGTLHPVSKILLDTQVGWGSQNMAPFKNGAYTGELSVESLVELGAKYVEIGHFERRTIFKETDEMIADKVSLALENNLIPIICIGEFSRHDLASVQGELESQIGSALSQADSGQLNQVVFAYEPAWAIGQREAADYTYVHKVHKLIRTILKDKYGDQDTSGTRLIYGGSVSMDNAEAIMDSPDVDGVFVGRFGHDINNFIEIVRLAQ